MTWWRNASTFWRWVMKTLMIKNKRKLRFLVDELRRDSQLAMLVGKSDIVGETRSQARDKGYPLASSSTLNRLELGHPDTARCNRYKRIAGDNDDLDRLFVDLFVESFDTAPKEIWLDLDATDDPLHGHQEDRFFHGYYHCYCYLPLYIFCGEHLKACDSLMEWSAPLHSHGLVGQNKRFFQ